MHPSLLPAQGRSPTTRRSLGLRAIAPAPASRWPPRRVRQEGYAWRAANGQTTTGARTSDSTTLIPIDSTVQTTSMDCTIAGAAVVITPTIAVATTTEHRAMMPSIRSSNQYGGFRSGLMRRVITSCSCQLLVAPHPTDQFFAATMCDSPATGLFDNDCTCKGNQRILNKCPTEDCAL